MRDNKFYRVISLFLFALLFAIPVSIFAQTTGSIGGVVSDVKDGSPLVGATIKIVGFNIGAITDDRGSYVILNVDVGTYTLEASYIGFEPKKVSNIRVSVDQRTKINFDLANVGVTTEVIQVEAERKGIDVEQSGRIIESQQIQNTGIRGVTNIVAKTAGVVQDERGGSLNIRGGRNNENIIIVDGMETTNPLDGSSRAFIPNNLLQEITVLTGGFGAEYGNVLSGVINVSTKSGTDRYTGSLELITDEFSGRWINTPTTGYNVYGLTFGGPIFPTKGLAKVFNFFGSFQRDFQRITIGSWILNKVPTIVPDGKLGDNENGNFSYNGRLNVNLNEIKNSKIPINLRFGGTVNFGRGRSLYGSNVYSPYFRHADGSTNMVMGTDGIKISNSYRNPVTESEDYQFFGRLTHNVSNKFFYELQFNYFRTFTKQYDPYLGDSLTWYGDTNHVAGLNAYYRGFGQGKVLGTDANTSFLYRMLNSVIDFYSKLDISYLGGKADFTYALLTKKFGDHEVKFGGEYKYHTLKRLDINPAQTADLSIQDPFDRWFSTNTARMKSYGYQVIDPVSGKILTDGNDAKHPITGGFYIRDKVSFADFNFNGGVRVDFMDVNTKVFKDLQNSVTGGPGLDPASDAAFTDSKMNWNVSPRLGFSFPVTDKIIFVAQYGKMIQLPQLNLLYVNQETLKRFLSTALQDVIENSSLTPTKLTQYEFGFKQQVGDYINLGVTAFYKESIDLIGAGRIKATADGQVPVGFVTYLNNDFAISRGLDFYLSMRRMNRLAIDVAYTLSYASGTGSDPYSKNSLANDSQQELPLYVYPLDYDQRHTGNINLDYRFGETDVPKGIMGDVLKNVGVNVLFSFNSGRPYQKRDVSYTATGSSGDIAQSAKNEVYRDWNFRIDLKVDKTVRVWKTNWNFYVYALNLLNTEIVNYVFPGTGKVDDNGYLQTPTGASKMINDPTFAKLWPERIKFFSNWGPPRQVRLGLNITF